MHELGIFTTPVHARSELALNKLLINPFSLVNISETPLSLWLFKDAVCAYWLRLMACSTSLGEAGWHSSYECGLMQPYSQGSNPISVTTYWLCILGKLKNTSLLSKVIMSTLYDHG